MMWMMYLMNGIPGFSCKKEKAHHHLLQQHLYMFSYLKQLNFFSSVEQIPWRREIASRIKDINERVNLVFSDMEKFELVSKMVKNDGPSKIISHRLKVSDPESKVLLTTRKEEVAEVMGTAPSNILKPGQISDHDCWLVMRQRAFQGKSDEKKNELEDVGEKIAKKCKGWPLAAKTLGGMLWSKDSIEEWREVLNSKLWELVIAENDIFPLIFLSYQELPPALKRCFLVLALFPKDFNIKVEQVGQIWMANGFLHSRTHEEMMKMGQENLETLESLAFLEKNDGMFRMHHIMHDFAQYISGDELLSIMVHGSTSESTSKTLSDPKHSKVRHLMIVGNNNNPTSIGSDFGKVRTCIMSSVPPTVTSDLVDQLKMARSLTLAGCKLRQVPESIVDMLHLRMLNLSYNPLVELPELIGNLYNLEQLYLEQVAGISSLPQSFGNLINLVLFEPGHLSLERFPKIARKLTNLQNLDRVLVEAGESSLGWLEDLNQLRGLLEIGFINGYDDEVDANKAAIGSKKHLTELTLFFSGQVITDGVVAALQPPPQIQTLRIYGLLPSWMRTSFNHLTELEFFDVRSVSMLPPFSFWKLRSLKTLHFSKCGALEFIGREFLGMDNNPNSTFSAFPELKVLKFSSCHELRGWEDLNPEEDENRAINVMPKIEILEFEDCIKFHELPRQLLRQASSLKKLSIRNGRLSFGINFKDTEDGVDGRLHLKYGFPWLEMIIKSSTKVPTSIIYPSYIKMLDLYYEKPNSYLPPMGKLPYLESLTIADFSSLKFFGREFMGIDDQNNDAGFVSFPNLVKLKIHSCELLEGWEDLKPEDEGKITVMPKLEALGIRHCSKFTKLPLWLHLKLSSLRELELHDGNFVLQELEVGILAALPQPPALECLKIQTYEGTYLPNSLRYLNNLTRLEVCHAVNVFSLPPLWKLPSLMFLTIDNFSSLIFIGREFLGIDNTTSTNIVAFPKLVKMELIGCLELKAWEDIKEEDEDKITIMPNLKKLKISYCYQLHWLPSRLIRNASSLEKLKCDYNNDVLAERIKKDKELLRQVKIVVVNRNQCSLPVD